MFSVLAVQYLRNAPTFFLVKEKVYFYTNSTGGTNVKSVDLTFACTNN